MHSEDICLVPDAIQWCVLRLLGCMQVRHLDFSVDGSVLQSSDASREMLYWHVTTAKQV
jgi:WD40 repeat protein